MVTSEAGKLFGYGEYGSISCFFADDFLVFCENKEQLRKIWRIIKKWSTENGIPVNAKKSAVLELKVDSRTHNDMEAQLNAEKRQKTYKYLGEEIGDDLSMVADLSTLKAKLKKLASF